jgi:hypothetical protein
MKEKFSVAHTMCNQLKRLRSDVEKIEGKASSGITAYISQFNSLLERTRQLFITDPSDLHGSQVLMAIGSVEPVEGIEERIDSAYHRRAKQQILASSGMLLEALEGYRQSATEDSAPVTQPKEFAFVQTSELRRILERDYIEI